MLIHLQFFLPGGFQKNGFYGKEAESILQGIGDSKRLSHISFPSAMGQTRPGTMYELTQDAQILLNNGSTTVYLQAGDLMLFHVDGPVSH